jgi:hypothetical protein
MGNLQNRKDNSPLHSAAEQMAEFIDIWRCEISENRDLAPNISPSKLEDFLKRAEKLGIRPTVSAYIILGCEFIFRIRRMTKRDINVFLDEMEARLVGGNDGLLTPLQAHILVKSVEPIAIEYLSRIRMPIAYGPWSSSDYVGLFLSSMPLGERRQPKLLIKPRRGRIPTLGPIIAGVWIDTVAQKSKGLGIELCEILLQRKIQPQEFAHWKSKLKEIIPELSHYTFLDDWLEC